MSIIVKQISYFHPDREQLFKNISFSVERGYKATLIGKNGSGKSTLLKILSNLLQPTSGEVIIGDIPYYIPQHFGQYDTFSVADVLGISLKIKALQSILSGDASGENFAILNDDWSIEERAISALAAWGLKHIELSDKMEFLSGGEKTKVFLSGIAIYSPSIILMDEPSNHLDAENRQKLYDFIQNSNATIVIVSHDRTLLNLLNLMFELHPDKIEIYGGNYDFYKQQKQRQMDALENQFSEKEKQLRHAKKVAHEAAERKQKLDVRGAKKQIKAGTPPIMMGRMKDKAEVSSSKLKAVHSEKEANLSTDLSQLRQKLGTIKHLKLDIDNASLRKGKILMTAKEINFKYTDQLLWDKPQSFQIKSGDRIVIKGGNGTGKTTLLKLILGQLEPSEGNISRVDFRYQYVDQEYSLIDNNLTVFEQIETFNSRKLLEHELKMLLNRYLFSKETWGKTCDKLSGGEKMKLVFCCMMVSNNAPEIFVLDEPTNNLDIDSLDIVTSAIKDYKGTLLVISHDQYFINEIGVDWEINL